MKFQPEEFRGILTFFQEDYMRTATAVTRLTRALPAEEALDGETIACLSNQTLEQLSPEELRRVIESCGHPWSTGLSRESLRYTDPGVLKRMACLARRCCQNRLAAEATGNRPAGESVDPISPRGSRPCPVDAGYDSAWAIHSE